MKQPKIYSILPKLLHRTNPYVKKPVHLNFTTCSEPYFLDCKMDFYFRKVLKHNGIKYTWHRKDRLLTVNYTGSPFKFFMIFDDNSNYITINRIPSDNWSYQINAICLDELLKKMVRFKIINFNNFKKIIVPINLQAEQLRLIYG